MKNDQIEEQATFRTCAIGVRFNSVQRAVIWPGLNRIVLAYATHRETGSADGYPFRIHPLAIIPRPGLSPGVFKAELMQLITDLWVRSNQVRVSACGFNSTSLSFLPAFSPSGSAKTTSGFD